MMGLILVGLGLLQTAWMVWAIRVDAARTHVSMIEAAILKAANEQPLPKSKTGVAFDRLQHWLGLFLGLALIGLGIVILLAE